MKFNVSSKEMDSGLIVVVFIISSLIITVFSFLLFVDYEWCHVLFKNNTENPACTKNDNMDKVLLKGSSIAEREEENRRYRESHHQIHQKLKQNFVSDENLQDINDKVHYDNEEQSNKW